MNIWFKNEAANTAASLSTWSGAARLWARFVSRPGSTSAARRRRRSAGFTLEEVVVSMAISALTIGGVATGYTTTAKRAEWSAASSAAQSSAVQQLELVRSARWEPLALPAVDELVSANFPVTTLKLDLPSATGSIAYVTNRTIITSIAVNPPLKMVRVESSWSFMGRGPFTNSVTTFRSP